MPAPLLIARWMASLGTLSRLAFSTAAKRRGFIDGSAPPLLAASATSRRSLGLVLAFLAPATTLFACSHWRPIVPVTVSDREDATTSRPPDYPPVEAPDGSSQV